MQQNGLIKLCGTIAMAMGLSFAAPAMAQDDVIKIGDISSYSTYPDHLVDYKKGMDMALDEINKAGGVNGKRLVVITRDDKATAGDAVRAAEDLISREQVHALTGSYISPPALALSEFSRKNKVPFLATMSLADRMIWEDGHRYAFRLRAGTYTQSAILAEKAAELKKKRWALIYPNYAFGQLAASNFKRMLKEAQPDVEFVAELATPLGKLDAAASVEALIAAKPEGILSVLFQPDLLKFARAGATQGLFEGREILGMTTGEPENLEPMKEDVPNGWWVTGYPWNDVKTPEHEKFLKEYMARYKTRPGISSIMGYTGVKTMAAAFAKAKSTDPEKVVDAMANLEVDMPWGKIKYRTQDNQSTMGSFLGQTAQSKIGPVMVNGVYKQGEKYEPTDAMVKQWRPATK